MINVNIIGRLGVDAELRTSSKGNQFVSMRVASNDYLNGENVTTWTTVMWSGERAVKMCEYLKKGSLITAFGKLRTSLFKNKNGEQSISIDIMADRVDFVSSGGNSATTQTDSEVVDTGKFTKTTKTSDTEMEAATAAVSATDDDLPF